MAKRKRGIAFTPKSSKSRRKAQQTSPHPHGDIDRDKAYKVRCILQEDATRYKIDWEDDSETGESYSPTWEPKENANQLAVEDWEKTKKKVQQVKFAKERQRLRSSRNSNVKEEHKSSAASVSPKRASQAEDVTVEIDESPQAVAGAVDDVSSPLFVPEDPVEQQSPVVQVSDPPLSFEQGAYVRYQSSQIPPSSEIPATSPATTPTPAARSTKATAQSTQGPTQATQSTVVPDSQSFEDESSFEGFSPSQTLEAPASTQKEEQTNLSCPAVGEAAPNEVGSREKLPQSQESEAPNASRAVASEPVAQTERTPTESTQTGSTTLSLNNSHIRDDAVVSGIQPHTERQPVSESTNSAEHLHLDSTGPDSESTENSPAITAGSKLPPQLDQLERLHLSPNTVQPAQSEIESRPETPGVTATRAAQTSQSDTRDFSTEESSLHDQELHHQRDNFSDRAAKATPARRDFPSSWAPTLADTGTRETRPIVISDESSSGRQNSSLESPEKPDYEHPPGGQKTPAASTIDSNLIQQTIESPSEVNTRGTTAFVNPLQALLTEGRRNPRTHRDSSKSRSTDNTQTESSFPFLTQIGHLNPSGSNSSIRSANTGAELGSHSTSQPVSSSFPSVPSRPPGTIGESAPQRLGTPSDLISPAQQASNQPSESKPSMNRDSGDSFRNRLEKMHARRSARSATPRGQTPNSTFLSSPTLAKLGAQNGSVDSSTISPERRDELTVGMSQMDDGRSLPATSAENSMPHSSRELSVAERYGALQSQAQDDSLAAEGSNPSNQLISNHTPHPTEDDETQNSLSAYITAKRPLETEDELEANDMNKRARLSPAKDVGTMTINPQDLEITHISDSMGKGTQDEHSVHSQSQDLRAELRYAQNQLDEHIESLSNLQYRHEEQRAKLNEVTKERDAAIKTAAAATQQMSIRDANNSTLRAERTELKKQLDDAQAKLIDHSIPERAEVEALRLELEKTKLEKEKAEKKAKKTEENLEYFRSVYQDASNKASSLAGEVTELTNQLGFAQNQASGEMVKAREMTKNMANKALAKRNRKLQIIVADNEAGLKFRDEEITRLKGRSRIGTRVASLPPRSPRLGSPFLTGRSSRQASPAATTGDAVKGRGPLHQLKHG